MMRLILFLCFVLFSCKQQPISKIASWTPYDETSEIEANKDHAHRRMQYKLIQSKVSDKNDTWKVIQPQIVDFSESEYQKLKPLIYEQDILTIQKAISSGALTYKKLTQWYLYRIAKYENDKNTTLHSIISINPEAVKIAVEKDNNASKDQHPIYGMPILLKDNINTAGMKTTGGAVILKDNTTQDAFIVKQLKSKGAIILGKANLSEWAYFFCSGCPVGYSAVGGQTLNPYGRKKFETGGSSSGSGTTMAANYAAAAIGTETSGSILSPSSQNSIVGLKPTIGLLSRSGIIPISSTLDTPGPMTRSVRDNAIILSALTGNDLSDKITLKSPDKTSYHENFDSDFLRGKKLGVIKNYLDDSLYQIAIKKIKNAGATIYEFDPQSVNFSGFVTFLNADMKVDLPKYLKNETSDNIRATNVKDIVEFNLKDTLVRAPYGQALFEGIVKEDITDVEFKNLKAQFLNDARSFFDTPMDSLNLDAIISINNWNAGHAAMAKYPCLTVPMGYTNNGEPKGLTFIAKSFEEEKLLKFGYAYEQLSLERKPPKNYN